MQDVRVVMMPVSNTSYTMGPLPDSRSEPLSLTMEVKSIFAQYKPGRILEPMQYPTLTVLKGIIEDLEAARNSLSQELYVVRLDGI